jgi:CRP-like cAMP-binding protein
MHLLHDPRQNHIIAALPVVDYAPLVRHLELVPMLLGHVLTEPGCQMQYVYFPTTAIVSSIYVLENGASAEFSVIGNEGVVGASLLMGGEATSSRSVVHGAGYAYRIAKKIIVHEFNRAGPMQGLLLRHMQSMLTQIAQTAVCNRHHSLDQQFCRCLLMRLDRSTSSELVLTQESIAGVLGVRREGVTEAAGRLQKAGLIEYRRGHIMVLDRAGLEERVCECYAVVKKESDRLLNGVRAWVPTISVVELLPVGLHSHGKQLSFNARAYVG